MENTNVYPPILHQTELTLLHTGLDRESPLRSRVVRSRTTTAVQWTMDDTSRNTRTSVLRPERGQSRAYHPEPSGLLAPDLDSRPSVISPVLWFFRTCVNGGSAVLRISRDGALAGYLEGRRNNSDRTAEGGLPKGHGCLIPPRPRSRYHSPVWSCGPAGPKLRPRNVPSEFLDGCGRWARTRVYRLEGSTYMELAAGAGGAGSMQPDDIHEPPVLVHRGLKQPPQDAPLISGSPLHRVTPRLPQAVT
jgi:hypothetical protein